MTLINQLWAMPWAARATGTCAHLLTKSLLFTTLLGLSFAAQAMPREVRVGVYENPPKILMGADQQPSGMFGDLLKVIADAEGWTLTAVPCGWDDCLERLKNGQIDLMPDVALTPERAAAFDFHEEAALNSWSELLAPERVRLASVLDLQGKRIVLLQNSVQASYLQNLLKEFGLKVTFVFKKNYDDVLAAVTAGQADVAVANHFFATLNARRYQLSSSNVMFQPVTLYFATAHGQNADLLTAIDRNLKVWRGAETSPLNAIKQKWLGLGTPPRYDNWIVGSLLAAMLVIALVLNLNRALKQLVARQTQQIQVDVEQLEAARQDLTHANAELSATLLAIPDLLFELSRQGEYLNVWARQPELLMEQKKLLFGRRVTEVLPPDAASKVMQAIEVAAQTGTSYGINITLDLPDGPHDFELSTAAKTVQGQASQSFMMLSRDVTERVRAQNELAHLALHDPLTGLPNRALFLDRLNQVLATARRTHMLGAILFIDLDHFKTANDVHGHAFGDQLLIQVAQRLQSCMRQGDTVARFGGDEFVIFVSELNHDATAVMSKARNLALKVRSTLLDPLHIEGQHYSITASIGISLFPSTNNTLEDLVGAADIAMYRAKEKGRNEIVFFEEAMQKAIDERYALERDLREAIGRQELKLYMHSKFDANGQFIGAEALLRWQHPERGLLQPAAFIALAEESSLIIDLGQWVLRQACQLIAELGAQGLSPRIAVNVSARQFHQADFLDQVKTVLADTGADPLYLTLEITESLLVERTAEVIARMLALVELGVRFSIDDFGTGYSSLAYLKRLPLSEIKIDKSFVQDVPHDGDDVALVQTMLSMAKHLGLDVVAEGVETQEQFEFLRSHGCEHFQGYLFHRPQESGAWLASLKPTPGA